MTAPDTATATATDPDTDIDPATEQGAEAERQWRRDPDNRPENAEVDTTGRARGATDDEPGTGD